MRIFIKIVVLIYVSMGPNIYAQAYSFKVKYGMIYAGTAELIYNLEQGILVGELTTNSSPWLANLWILADSIKSTYNLESGLLEEHIKAIHEGSYHRNYSVEFADSNRVLVNGKEEVVPESGLRDVPSLLYDLSKYDFRDGEILEIPLWDGRSYGILSLRVEKVGKPSLFHPLSSPGWKLTPLNSSRKSRENRIQLALLLSKSVPHIPLRIEIDTKYGYIVMRLEEP